jgi:hypothetical protein
VIIFSDGTAKTHKIATEAGRPGPLGAANQAAVLVVTIQVGGRFRLNTHS